MRLTGRGAATLVALAMLVAACGGGDTGASTTTTGEVTATTKQDWQMQLLVASPSKGALPKGGLYWGMADFTRFQRCPHPCYFPLRTEPRFDAPAVPESHELKYPTEGVHWFPVAYEVEADNDDVSFGAVQDDTPNKSSVWLRVLPYDGQPGGWFAKIWLYQEGGVDIPRLQRVEVPRP